MEHYGRLAITEENFSRRTCKALQTFWITDHTVEMRCSVRESDARSAGQESFSPHLFRIGAEFPYGILNDSLASMHDRKPLNDPEAHDSS